MNGRFVPINRRLTMSAFQDPLAGFVLVESPPSERKRAFSLTNIKSFETATARSLGRRLAVAEKPVTHLMHRLPRPSEFLGPQAGRLDQGALRALLPKSAA